LIHSRFRDVVRGFGAEGFRGLISCALADPFAQAAGCLKLLEETWPGGQWVMPETAEALEKRARAWKAHWEESEAGEAVP
jgi:hypothetical protein